MNEQEKAEFIQAIDALNRQHDLVMSLGDTEEWQKEFIKLEQMAREFKENFSEINQKLNEQGVGAFVNEQD